MLNMIKMDLYRMVRTKSMYVVWIVMAAAIFFSTSMSKLDIDTMNKEAEQQQTENIAETVKPETIKLKVKNFTSIHSYKSYFSYTFISRSYYSLLWKTSY